MYAIYVKSFIESHFIQDVTFEKLTKWKAVAQKQCIFDPMLVMPKCTGFFFENCKQTAENCKQTAEK